MVAQSIRHWLQATGLTRSEAKGELCLTQLAKTLWRNDPFLEDPFSWWILHIELIRNETGVTTWHWFFNNYGQKRFAKEACLSSLYRFASSRSTRKISPNTLERDVATFLSTYAKSVPLEQGSDPEDSYDCPLQDLDLLTVFRSTKVFRVNDAFKQIPPEALGYSLATSIGVEEGPHFEEKFERIVSSKNSPNRCFCLSPSQLFDLVETASEQLGPEMIDIGGLAGQRTVRYRSLSPLQWAEHYYNRHNN